VILYGYQILYLALKEKHRLRVFENKEIGRAHV
jgi:hypothetical protein